MAEVFEHVWEGFESGNWRNITYGKCVKSPYVENNLWFVNIPSPRRTVTYLVTQEYANAKTFESFDGNPEMWEQVARLVIVGSDWNPKEECSWKDMPYYVHVLPDNTPIRYGLSRSQSKAFPKRELWYVVPGLGEDLPFTSWSDNPYEGFIVDKLCTNPDFMNKMGSSPERWRLICWATAFGIEPWYALIDDELIPDPYYVLKKDAAKANRSLGQRFIDSIFHTRADQQETLNDMLRESDTREEY